MNKEGGGALSLGRFVAHVSFILPLTLGRILLLKQQCIPFLILIIPLHPGHCDRMCVFTPPTV